MSNTRAKFLSDLKAELTAEGYIFVSLRNRELRVILSDGSNPAPVEVYFQQKMGSGINTSFCETWPPGFEFVGSEHPDNKHKDASAD